MKRHFIPALVCLSFLVVQASGGGLTAFPEYSRPGPDGAIVAADRNGEGRGPLRAMQWRSARGGYVSCHLVASLDRPGEYLLQVQMDAAGGKIQVDLFREWFHRLQRSGEYYPDALIPVSLPYSSRLPDPDNRIEAQESQAFWLDIWVSPDTPPGSYRGRAILGTEGADYSLPLELTVLEHQIPGEDPLVMDHNSYGTAWLGNFYPGVRDHLGSRFYTSEEFFDLIHSYHRIFYEHRGIFHQLGYGHGGKTGREFAPELKGIGRDRHVSDWTLYDRHYEALLNGSAFAGSRRGARPIPFVYLPINPEWPARFVNWGEPGYEVEFVNVVSEMEQHFRQKGWTQTKFEMFFNHKKRYKAFHWDGDETRFAKDQALFGEYRRLLEESVPSDSPVRFVFRNDASWTMEQQFEELGGIIDFWVCGGGMFSWFPGAPKLLKGRGDLVWIYGGTPTVDRPASEMAVSPLRVWLFGIDGYVHWLTTDPGSDPWFAFGGGGTVLAYPGDRFGLDRPIPSIRLKLQRNVIQDLAVLDGLAVGQGLEKLKNEVAEGFSALEASDWWCPRPALADTPPIEWSNLDIDEAQRPCTRRLESLDPGAWENVRTIVLDRIMGGSR